jgi:site-specific DNA-methyltransferase (adenine-specific)
MEKADAREFLKRFRGARLVVLDPPYRGPTDVPPRGRDDGAGGQVFNLFGFFHEVFVSTRNALMEGGVAMTFCDFKRTGDVCQLAFMAGLRLNTCIAWTWNRMGTGGLFRSSWSPILIFSRGSADALSKDAVPNQIHCEPVPPQQRRHVYEKPVAIYRHVFKRVLRPGDVVVDPFAGSGSSKSVAEEFGALWQGCDIVLPEEYDLSRNDEQESDE